MSRGQLGFICERLPHLPLPLCALPLPLVLALRPLSNRSDAPRWLSLSAHLPRWLHHACVLAGLATAVSPTQAYRYRCERTKRRRERGVSQSIDESRVSRMLDGYALSSPSRSICCPPLSICPLLYSTLLYSTVFSLARSRSVPLSVSLSFALSLSLSICRLSLIPAPSSSTLLAHPCFLPSFLRVYAAMYARVSLSLTGDMSSVRVSPQLLYTCVCACEGRRHDTTMRHV